LHGIRRVPAPSASSRVRSEAEGSVDGPIRVFALFGHYGIWGFGRRDFIIETMIAPTDSVVGARRCRKLNKIPDPQDQAAKRC